MTAPSMTQYRLLPPDRPADEVERELLARWEEEKLFAQALACDPSLPAEDREQWAYCKLHRVVEQLNQAPQPASFQDLDRC